MSQAKPSQAAPVTAMPACRHVAGLKSCSIDEKLSDTTMHDVSDEAVQKVSQSCL